ncbi:hypothetical protein GGX14DRAFT_392121 [Mycena pura]|uniref:Uncharacterized protein n=1 Tax=Mycena pura TaxID=153505 RepID=A0AAD6YFU3_9AGAR|nr:hypothetical protein GGX14DRAFT_392121 [Mycena pura]
MPRWAKLRSRLLNGRTIRGEWIKFRNTSQNEGLDGKKYSVRLQGDSMAVLCTATMANMADRKKVVVAFLNRDPASGDQNEPQKSWIDEGMVEKWPQQVIRWQEIDVPTPRIPIRDAVTFDQPITFG